MKKIEIFIHILFWFMLFLSINVDWTSNWFDISLRPKSPAPLSVIIFFLYFYINFLILIPKYFAIETWGKYIFWAFVCFILPEIIRIVVYKSTINSDFGFENLLFSRDSFIFGAPSPFFFALNLSFVYRLTKGWLLNKYQIKELEESSSKNEVVVPYKNMILLSDGEAKTLEVAIMGQLRDQEIYLNPDLTLRDLAERVDSTEKKVSYLINQNLDTSFYELINGFRVEKFKLEVAKPENKSLSIVGLALNCGFSSKSSFYRAFKSQVSISPTEYIKKATKDV